MRKFSTHGDGRFDRTQFRSIGENVIIERETLVFHPETIEIGDNVYIGHRSMMKGYPGGFIKIGSDTWIGQNCFFHGAGGLTIGNTIGIGPNVVILTSDHEKDGAGGALLEKPLRFAPVTLCDGCHIGASVTILPGVRVGRFARIAAGAVVVSDVPEGELVGGVPAKIIRTKR